jgi:1,2-phenylacetyl-CoA epoxidase catalytic subunit
VVDTFGRAASERLEIYRKYRLRERSNEELLGRWRNEVEQVLDSLSLKKPAGP